MKNKIIAFVLAVILIFAVFVIAAVPAERNNKIIAAIEEKAGNPQHHAITIERAKMTTSEYPIYFCYLHDNYTTIMYAVAYKDHGKNIEVYTLGVID